MEVGKRKWGIASKPKAQRPKQHFKIGPSFLSQTADH